MNTARIYAEALWQYLRDTPDQKDKDDAHAETFIALLKKRGHYTLLPSILREFEKIEAAKKTKKGGTLTCAEQSDVERCTARLKEYGIKDGTDIKVEIDKKLIGGFRYEGEDIVVDGCYRSKLLNLYREITA